MKREKLYQVDESRKGTCGRRETSAVKKQAETRAAEIEKQFASNGTEGLAMSMNLRAQAFTAQKILARSARRFSKRLNSTGTIWKHARERRKAP